MRSRYNQHNSKYDRHRYPGIALVAMHIPVAIDADQGRQNDNNSQAIPKPKAKNGNSQCSKTDGGDHEIGREPHGEVVDNVNMSTSFRRDTFNTMCLNTLFFWDSYNIGSHFSSSWIKN